MDQTKSTYEVVRDIDDGEVTPGFKRERWFLNKELHNDAGPAVIIRHPATNEVVCQEWWTDGVLGREGAPARIYSGSWDESEWFVGGVHHREGGPAITRRDPQTGILTEVAWYQHGQLHREGGLPALEAREEDTGVLEAVEYREHGKRHRLDGPAYIERDSSGKIIAEEWYQDGKPIPLGGSITRSLDGQTPGLG